MELFPYLTAQGEADADATLHKTRNSNQIETAEA